MARNHRRLGQNPRLNLVALMDIFTILVLFLMVNNGDVEVLQADRNIDLPESVSEQRPELALTIKVSAADISVGGARVALVEEALAQPQQTLAPLATELRGWRRWRRPSARNSRSAAVPSLSWVRAICPMTCSSASWPPARPATFAM